MTWKLCGALILLAALALPARSDDAGLADTALSQLRDAYRRPDAIPFPEDNPFDPAKAELGRSLFFDPILSQSGRQSCSSCHVPDRSWSDGRPRAIGDAGRPMALRSPTLLDVAWTLRLGWDGKFHDLESVAFAAMTGPANMNLPEAEALARLQSVPTYAEAFARVFGEGGITRRQVELALATYQRTLVSAVAPFDQFVAGDRTAISREAAQGFLLFNGRAGCAACHSGWSLTDGSFHDIGTAEGEDRGRGRLFPSSIKLQHAFKTPTLRDVASRGPYMHDGSVPTLADVITLYDKGGIDRPSRSELIHPLGLSAAERAALLEFLRTLSPPAP